MKIISFVNSKGGVGKTSACMSIGCCLAEMGHKTLMIDLDHQGNLSDDFGRGDEDYTVSDLFENPKFDINLIIYPALNGENPINNLFLIPSDITLAVESRSAERFRHRLQILQDAISRVMDKFDFILIDCRPAIDLSIENALLVSDFFIIPVDQDKRALKGIQDLFEVIDEVKRGCSFKHLVVNMKYDLRNKIMISKVEGELIKMNLNVAKVNIKTSELYKQASISGVPSVLYEKGLKLKDNYMELTQEVLGQI